MKIATVIARVLLGLVFVVFGSNILHPFLPMPPMHGPAADFVGAMAGTGYLKVIGLIQVVGGAILLIGKYVPLGLTLLGPVIVNILLFHTFIDRSGLPVAIIVCAIALFLVWRYRSNFAGLLKA
jgi:putative oxidoreductase